MQTTVRTLRALMTLAIFVLVGVFSHGMTDAQEIANFSDLSPTAGQSQAPTNQSSENPAGSPFPRFQPGKFTPPSPSQSGPVASAETAPIQTQSILTSPPIDENTLRRSLQPPADAVIPGSRSSQPSTSNPMQELSPSRLTPMGEFNRPAAQSAPSILARQNGQAAPSQRIQSQQIFQTPNRIMSVQPEESPQSRIPTRPGSAVQPAGFNSPLKPAEPERQLNTPAPSNLTNARQLIEMYDVSSAPQPLPGVPVSMLEMLQKTPSQLHQQMVSQYWETFFDWAALRNRTEYVNWLNQIPQPRSQAENALLYTAKSNAKNQVLAAEIQLGKSQSKLQEFISVDSYQQLPPLPLNQPLISKYTTHYQWYASRNLLPSKLKGIDLMLQKTLELIVNRAETVRSAQSATKQSQAALASGQANVASLLEAGRLWQDALQGLNASVVSYNQAVGDYALTISPNKAAEQIVGMLIAVPKSEPVTQNSAEAVDSIAPSVDSTINDAASRRGQVFGARPEQFGSAASSNLSDGSQAIGPNVGTYRRQNPSFSSKSGQSQMGPRKMFPSSSNVNPVNQPQIPTQPGGNVTDRFGDTRSQSGNMQGQSIRGGAQSNGAFGGGGFSPQPNSGSSTPRSSGQSGQGGGSFQR